MSTMDLIDNEEERQFYRDVHEILKNAKSTAYAAVNDIKILCQVPILNRTFKKS